MKRLVLWYIDNFCKVISPPDFDYVIEGEKKPLKDFILIKGGGGYYLSLDGKRPKKTPIEYLDLTPQMYIELKKSGITDI